MRVIEPSHEFLDEINGAAILRKIEQIGRLCYKSEDRIAAGTAPQFVKMLIARGHEAMIEHVGFSVHFVTDRGVSHELVRHRPASYAQESTRYCNYANEKFGNHITFVAPPFEPKTWQYAIWQETMAAAEAAYFELIKSGAKPEQARAALPNSLKTEIVVTANLREWRHILRLRTAADAHPQMRQLMRPLLTELKVRIPVVFDDIAA